VYTDDPEFWSYDRWPSGEPYEWMDCARESEWDRIDFHVDLGCGTIKKGRIGIDRFPAPGVSVLMDLNALDVLGLPRQPGKDATMGDIPMELTPVFGAGGRGLARRTNLYLPGFGLPFPDDSIESMVSHHALEHIGTGFVALVDEIYRVLAPGAVFRAITPLFPSRTAVEDPDHIRYFMEGTWETFCGSPEAGGHWMESFSVPYTKARFELLDKDVSPPVAIDEQWGPDDAREIRVALRAVK